MVFEALEVADVINEVHHLVEDWMAWVGTQEGTPSHEQIRYQTRLSRCASRGHLILRGPSQVTILKQHGENWENPISW